jgi:PleD family two-component response regulator
LSQFRDSDTPEDLMHRADNRLYQAKRSGRNLVVCDDISDDASKEA